MTHNWTFTSFYRTSSDGHTFIAYRENYLSLKTKSLYRHLNDDTIEKLITDSFDRPIVLLLITEWLGAADVMDVYMEELAVQFGQQIRFYRQDVEKYTGIYQNLGIKQLPATIFLQNGEIVNYFSGMISKAMFIEKLQTLLVFPESWPFFFPIIYPGKSKIVPIGAF